MKQFLKRNDVPLFITAVLIFIGFIGIASFKSDIDKEGNRFAPKTYSVFLSKDAWIEVLQVIDSSQKMLLKSDLPAREVSGVSFKLSQVNQTIQMQVSEQLAEEQKAAAKKDSIDKAKPKNK